MGNFLWLIFRLKDYKFLFVLILLGSLVQSLSTAGISLIVKGVVDGAFLSRNIQDLYRTVAIFLLLAFTSQLGAFIFSICTNLFALREKQKLRKDLFERLLNASAQQLLKSTSGDITTRMLSDLELYSRLLTQNIPKIIKEPFVVIALIGVLVYRDIFLSLFLVLFLPIISLGVKYFGDKKGKHTKRMQEQVSNLTQDLNQSIKGYENIKVYNAEKKFFEWFESVNRKAYKAGFKVELYTTLNSTFNFLTGYFIIALIILYGGVRVINGSLTTGEFLSYITALTFIQIPLMETQKGFMELKSSIPVISRIREILNLNKEEDGGAQFRFRDQINITRLYVKISEEAIIKDVSLVIRKGEKLGIMGHTGSGKSTLLRVLCGFYDYEGSIKIDGVELRDINKKSLRTNVGFVTQEPFIFLGTVKENLIIAKESATDEELWSVLNLAKCDFVKSLDQQIEEGGKNLSGGEKQRLALARLFLKNPQIILLDEATSALDARTESEVLKNLFDFFKDRTIIVVAHRFSNIKLCERVILFEKGSTVFEGDSESVIREFLHRA